MDFKNMAKMADKLDGHKMTFRQWAALAQLVEILGEKNLDALAIYSDATLSYAPNDGMEEFLAALSGASNA